MSLPHEPTHVPLAQVHEPDQESMSQPLQGPGQGSSQSEGRSDAVNVASPVAIHPGRHQTKLYTAYLEVQTPSDSTAPQPVDLVGVTTPPSTSSAPDNVVGSVEPHAQPAALQTESRSPSPATGRLFHCCSVCAKHNCVGGCLDLCALGRWGNGFGVVTDAWGGSRIAVPCGVPEVLNYCNVCLIHCGVALAH